MNAMTTAKRYILGCTHIAVLGLGLLLGFREAPMQMLPVLSNGAAPPVPPKSKTEAQASDDRDSNAASALVTSAEYSAAWDSLKDRFLPRQERLLIQKNLLEEWSVIDLEAAVHAVFAETTDEMIDCCAPGIQAAPTKAWELVRARAFGMETLRFRRQWLKCMMGTKPVQVFSIVGELPKGERLSTLASLAEFSCTDDDPAIRTDIWNQLISQPGTPVDQELINCVGERICYFMPTTEFATRLLGEITTAEQKFCISALSRALVDVVEDEDFPKPLFQLPAEMRGEVAANALKYGVQNESRALFLANVALESGNLDALQAADADPAFACFAEEMKQPLALAEWALRLPQDPRTLEIFRQSIEGAASGDFAGVRAKLQALPQGWQREQGLRALAKVEKEHAEDGE